MLWIECVQKSLFKRNNPELLTDFVDLGFGDNEMEKKNVPSKSFPRKKGL